MNSKEIVLREEERIVYTLRSLYQRYGYSAYRMSRFEEYDLYARNKDFLISDDVITFTDTNGKLMALKPDVTLSIVRNIRDRETRKLYYNENVYRKSRGTNEFREMVQVGLECIGRIDTYLITEVLTLAAESLVRISEKAVLNISHLGLISEMVDRLGVTDDIRKRVLRCIEEKNRHELEEICRKENADADACEKLCRLTMVYGNPENVLAQLRDLGCSDEYVHQLEMMTSAIESAETGVTLNMDFSVVNDMGYYNGIVFKGFVPGVPTDVLSGGQYDRLMKKMGKECGAIGFAVYMDALDRLFEEDTEYDVDTVLLYNENTSVRELTRAMRTLTQSGLSVTALKDIPEKLRYKQMIRIGGED